MARHARLKYHCQQRPQNFLLNHASPLARDLVFAGLGNVPKGMCYRDSSPYGNHGTLTGMVPAEDWVWVSELGRFGINTSGTSEDVRVSSNLGLHGATAVSACVWLCGIDDGPWISVPSINHSSQGIFLWKTAVIKAQFAVYTGGGVTAINSSVDVAGTAAAHVCGVYDGATLQIFVNGVSAAAPVAKTGTVNVTYNKTFFGVFSDGYRTAGNAWAGDIIDPMLWNRALSVSEIQQLADPSNVMLSGLILPPRRRLFGVSGAAPAGNRRRRLLIAGVPR